MDTVVPFMLLCIFGAPASLALSQFIRNRYGINTSLVPLTIFGLFMLGAYHSIT